LSSRGFEVDGVRLRLRLKEGGREGGRERGKGEGKKVSEEIFFSNVFQIDCCSSSWI